ncbi:MAG: Hemolysin activator protein precursor [Herbaspirillum sp.]|jgi:hemolysin activation/secretion protein|nr:Hemolysin activator protein precursor [Herbaspirillum sp.]
MQERERQMRAPKSDLQASRPAPDNLTLPVESPCFAINRFVLAVPPQLPPGIRAAGASDLPLDPFRFALDYLEQYDGACIGKDGLNLIVRRLTDLILAKGYSTTRLGVPEQDLSSGGMTLTLVPGVIGAIRFADPSLSGTWKNAFPAAPGDLLNLRDLEQGLEQMKRIPSQDIDMQIVPGAMPGESDVVITVKRGRPWKITATLDDSGAKGTGKLQAGLNAALDNALGLNDLFNIGINTDADRKGGQRGTSGNNLYYTIPFGHWNFTVSASSYDYHQEIAARQNFVSSGKSRNLEFNIRQLFHRDQYQKHSWQFKVGKRWNRAYIDDTEIEVQRRNTSFAELAWVHTSYIGNAQLDLTIANRWGVSWFNGQPDLEPRETDASTHRYSLQTIDASLVAPFRIGNAPFTYIGALRTQSSRSLLYQSEQFSIGNRYTVRGFDGEQTLMAERGFYLRNEIEAPLGGSGQAVYAGLDVGRVFGPSAQCLLGSKMAGAVIGLRGGAAGLRYDAFVTWAVAKPEGFRTDVPAVGFSLSYQY